MGMVWVAWMRFFVQTTAHLAGSLRSSQTLIDGTDAKLSAELHPWQRKVTIDFNLAGCSNIICYRALFRSKEQVYAASENGANWFQWRGKTKGCIWATYDANLRLFAFAWQVTLCLHFYIWDMFWSSYATYVVLLLLLFCICFAPTCYFPICVWPRGCQWERVWHSMHHVWEASCLAVGEVT